MKPNKTEDTITELRDLVTEHAATSPLSGWSVGMHIHHALLASVGIAEALKRSTPGERKPVFHLARTIIMLTGKIPRGRAKAPAPSSPDESVTADQLLELVSRADASISTARECHQDSWWNHPFFGVLLRDPALKFMGIHNAHHLAIVRDILQT